MNFKKIISTFRYTKYILAEIAVIVVLMLLNESSVLSSVIDELLVLKPVPVVRVTIIFLVIVTLAIDLSLIILVLLVAKQLISIIRNQMGNSPRNYFRSIYATYRMQRYGQLIVIERFNQNTSSKEKLDQITLSYNRAIRNSVVAYNQNRITVMLRIPDLLQAQDVLDKNIKNIESKIKAENTAYTFSRVRRSGDYYVIEGISID